MDGDFVEYYNYLCNRGNDMVKHKLTGANYGLNTWLQQRMTAIIMLIISLLFLGVIFYIKTNLDGSIQSWQYVFNNIMVKIVVQIFFIAMIIHAWIGIRDIWMDYIKCSITKLSLHLATILWLVGCLIYSIKVIW
jgi:succinate dehydrogenase / fumarate reductase membrane anchor subunit